MDIKKIKKAIKKNKGQFKLVLIIVFIILLVGLVFFSFKDKPKKEVKKLGKKELNKKQLADIKKRIKVLEPQKDQLEKTENWYFLIARIIIGSILLTINGLYLYYDNLKDFSLEDQLNINAGMALIYSFVAFILYGTPNALVNAIKTRTSEMLLQNHIHVLTELENLQKEEKEIEEYLRNQEEK